MAKGDAWWDTVKTILGWILNTLHNNIALPPHHLTRLRTILSSVVSTQWRVALKKWQHIHGELRSMALAIPAAIGLFSVLQDALKSSNGHRVRPITHTNAFLQDFSWLDLVALFMVVSSDCLNTQTYVFNGKEAVGTGMGPP
jgi:hypothetical protein